MNPREFKHFLLIARASNCELQTQLEIARTLGYGDQTLLDEAERISLRIGQMLSKLLSTLKAKLADR